MVLKKLIKAHLNSQFRKGSFSMKKEVVKAFRVLSYIELHKPYLHFLERYDIVFTTSLRQEAYEEYLTSEKAKNSSPKILGMSRGLLELADRYKTGQPTPTY